MLTRGRSIPVYLPEIVHIESLLTAGKAWRDRVSKLFLKKNSVWNSLLEVRECARVIAIIDHVTVKVLLPRLSVEMKSEKHREVQWERVVGDGSRHMDEEIARVVDAEMTEWEEMRKLQERNRDRHHCYELSLTKASHFNDLRQPFCVCKRSASPNMIECQLCKDWFHTNCVLPTCSQAGQRKAFDKSKFLCGCCVRSKRPALDMANLLVQNMKKVPVLLPEAVALERLAHRATEWQLRARQALLLAKDSVAQLAIETKLPVAKNQKSSCDKQTGMHGSGDKPDIVESETNSGQGGELEVDVEAISPLSEEDRGEHMSLRDDLRVELEELMFEGDLLELTVNETQQIWQLLQTGCTREKTIRSLLVGEEVSCVADCVKLV